MSKKIIAIVQARMGSSRLPGKVLMDIEERPMLWHVMQRVKASRLVNDAVIATSSNKKDDEIERFAKEYNFNIFRGSEDDCLDRYYQAAKKFKADIIVRITADCPLMCPEVIDKVISGMLRGGYDYATNAILYTYPDGCDMEAFSFKALKKAWKECSDPVYKEHVSPYIRNSDEFKRKNVENDDPVDPGEYKWSVDRMEDMEFVRAVYKYLYKGDKVFLLKDIMDLLKRRPEIKKINSGMIMNEGVYRSIFNSPAVKPRRYKISNSVMLRKRAEKIIPDCSQTFSKGPSQYVQGVAPVFLEKGKGSHVWDIDGNEYIDYAMALGPVILGHNYSVVTDSVKRILGKGTTFTLPHRLEAELAGLLCDIIPCAEMVRFGKNGSDATSGAVRVARAYTGRDKIACCGYHGWQDWYIGTTTRNKGIPKSVSRLTLTFEYNKIETLEKIFNENKREIACVIMEAVGIVEPADGFLEKVKELTHKNGALLIFDEVVTGFRLSLGGAQEYFNVIPDLACFGKAMANGFPISAVVGRRDVMRLFKDVFFSFTFGGEILSIAAAIATINELKDKDVIRYLWERGRRLKDGSSVLIKGHGLEKYVESKGLLPRVALMFKDRKGDNDLMLKSLFQQECVRRGILFTSSHNLCFSHSSQDIDYTLRVYNTVFKVLKAAIEKKTVRKEIKGVPVSPVFRKA